MEIMCYRFEAPICISLRQAYYIHCNTIGTIKDNFQELPVFLYFIPFGFTDRICKFFWFDPQDLPNSEIESTSRSFTSVIISFSRGSRHLIVSWPGVLIVSLGECIVLLEWGIFSMIWKCSILHVWGCVLRCCNGQLAAPTA
jgi:hypothetical protein